MRKLKVVIEVDIEVDDDLVEHLTVDVDNHHSAGRLNIEATVYGSSVYDTINVVTLHGAKIEKAD